MELLSRPRIINNTGYATDWFTNRHCYLVHKSSLSSYQQAGLQIFLKVSTKRKFLEIFPIANITDNPGTSVDLNEAMRAMPMSTINHKNNVLVLLLVHRPAVKADTK